MERDGSFGDHKEFTTKQEWTHQTQSTHHQHQSQVPYSSYIPGTNDKRALPDTSVYPYGQSSSNYQPGRPGDKPQGYQGTSTSFETKINQFFNNNQPTILPSCSAWFDKNGIHQIERDMVPEFFTGKTSKTPQVYTNLRNRMIKLYQEDPKTYLTATTCRKNIVGACLTQPGDACAIIRIHSFLEHWGLINFNFEPKNHNFDSIIATSEHNLNHLEAKLDPVVKEKKRVDPSSENDPYFHTLMSLTRKIRPICDYSGLPCGTVWYVRYPEGQEVNPVVQGRDPITGAPISDPSELREHNRPGMVVLSEEAFTTGKYPKCFEPSQFKRETLSDRLHKANKNSKFLYSS